jgi:hypothetical protein
MKKTSEKIIIPYHSSEGYIFTPPVQFLFDHEITEEELDKTLQKLSKKIKNHNSCINSSYACNLIISSFIFLVLLSSYVVGFILIANRPNFTKGFIHTALVDKKVRTIAYGGDPTLKVKYLKEASASERVAITVITTKPSNTEIKNAFKSASLYIDLELLDLPENEETLCEELRSSKSTFFGGFNVDSGRVNILKKCRPLIDTIYYIDRVSTDSWMILLFWFLGSLAFVFAFPIIGFLFIKNYSKKSFKTLEDDFNEESKYNYESRGVRFMLNESQQLVMHLQEEMKKENIGNLYQSL